MNSTKMTVETALRGIEGDEPGAVLKDGADTWTAENLRRSLDDDELDRECVWDDGGITLLDDRGYQITPRWVTYVESPK